MTKRRTPRLPLAVSAMAIVLLGPSVAGVQPAAADPTPVRLAPQATVQAAPQAARPDLQAIMDSVTSDSASSIIAEVVDEHGRWRGTSGVAQLGKHQPPPPDGRFRVGSVTKTFVSTVVLQLVGEGRLGLDDSVEHWLPGVVSGGDKITLRQLLNHTSGIFNYTNDPKALPFQGQRFLDETRVRTYTPAELVKIATAHPANFPPGTAWSYSNTNYVLAGLVVEKVTGHTWADEVRQRIIEPLGLRHTTIPGMSRSIAGPHSHSYMLLFDGQKVRTVDITEINPSWAGSSGEIISTTDDLNRFYAALLGGQLLAPPELTAMKTTVETGVGYRYGLALFQVALPCGVTIWGHDGSIPHYVTVSLHTEDGKRQLTASITPLLDRASLNELIVAAFCGPGLPGTPGPVPTSTTGIFWSGDRQARRAALPEEAGGMGSGGR